MSLQMTSTSRSGSSAVSTIGHLGGLVGQDGSTPSNYNESNSKGRRSVPSHVGEDQNQLKQKQGQHLYVLPVMLLEFLALALTRAVIPSLLLQVFDDRVYIVMGCVDAVRGMLAFISSPTFGKISDVFGRRLCLLVTVLGSCAPVCSLAFFPWDYPLSQSQMMMGWRSHEANAESLISAESSSETEDSSGASGAWPAATSTQWNHYTVHPTGITLFLVLLCVSGIFSSTFPLVFAYISDTVRQQEDRVAAYGLALATFGLSFTIGPISGGYIAQVNPQYVFLCSLVLTTLDLLYIFFILPESKTFDEQDVRSESSIVALQREISWNPVENIRVLTTDPFLLKVGQVAFLYYTGVWALISTFSVYAVKRFHLGPERLGELMASLGLCTILAEAVLVRFCVPLVGEKRAMKVGLIAFGVQCVVLAFAYEPWHLFISVGFSLLGHMVYPSLSSLVSGSVEPDKVGEALGAINGVRALTEGIGPLIFGSLMTFSEHSMLPGWPYLIAAIVVFAAYVVADELPDPEEDDYVHELERKHRRQRQGNDDFMMKDLADDRRGEEDEELDGLLSEIDDSEDREPEVVGGNNRPAQYSSSTY